MHIILSAFAFLLPFAFRFHRTQCSLGRDLVARPFFPSLLRVGMRNVITIARVIIIIEEKKRRKSRKMHVEKRNATEYSSETAENISCVYALHKPKPCQNRIVYRRRKKKNCAQERRRRRTGKMLHNENRIFLLYISRLRCWFPLFRSLTLSLRLAIARLMHIIILFAK